MKNSLSIDLFCNCQYIPEINEGELTILQMWDKAPMGTAIKDQSYLDFLDFLNQFTLMSFPSFARNQMPELWNMTPAKAKNHINIWAKNKKKLDPDYFENDRKEYIKRYLS